MRSGVREPVEAAHWTVRSMPSGPLSVSHQKGLMGVSNCARGPERLAEMG
jgi:hypothetical protein